MMIMHCRYLLCGLVRMPYVITVEESDEVPARLTEANVACVCRPLVLLLWDDPYTLEVLAKLLRQPEFVIGLPVEADRG